MAEKPPLTAGSFPVNSPPSRRRSPVRRFVLSLLWGLLAPILVVAVLVFFGSQTITLQWVAQQVLQFTDGRLQVEGISGSVFSELAADSVRWQDERGVVTVTSPRFIYHPLALLEGRIRVERISAVDVRIELPPAAPADAPREPVRLPQALAAVLPVAIERIDAQRLFVARGGEELFRLRNLEAVVRHEGDRLTTSILNVEFPVEGHALGLRGEVAVLARAPYATDGRLLVRMPMQPQPLRLDVRINGPLEELSIRAATTIADAPLEARTVLYPLDPRPLRHVRLDLKDLDLSRRDPTLPVTRVTGSYEAEVMPAWASGIRPLLVGPLTLDNALAGPIDRARLPVATMKAMVRYAGGRLEVQELEAAGPLGDVAGEASIGRDGMRLVLASEKLLLREIASTMADRTLSARIAIQPTEAAGRSSGGMESAGTWNSLFALGAAGGRTLDLDVNAGDASLAARMRGVLSADRLQIKDADVQSRPGRGGRAGHAAFRGTVGISPPWPVDLSGNFRDFDPAHLVRMPPAMLNGTWRFAGLTGAAEGGVFEAEVTLANSRFIGLPLAGRFAANVSTDRLSPRRVSAVEADVQWGTGTVEASGALGGSSDTLRLVLDMPNLGEVQEGLKGGLKAQASLRGPLRSPSLEGTGQAQNLVAVTDHVRATIGGAQVQVRSAQVQTGLLNLFASFDDVAVGAAGAAATAGAAGTAGAASPVGGAAARARAGKATTAPDVLKFSRLMASVDGSLTSHEAGVTASGADQWVRLVAKGGLADDGQWHGVLQELEAAHPSLRMPGAPATAAAAAPAEGAVTPTPMAGARPRHDLRLREPVTVALAPRRATARGARLEFQDALVNFKQANWRESVLTLSAEASNLPVHWLGRFMPLEAPEGFWGETGMAAAAALVDLNRTQDLRLSAALDFTGNLADRSGTGWRGRLEVERERGDIWLNGSSGDTGVTGTGVTGTGVTGTGGIGPTGEGTTAGLQSLRAGATLEARVVDVALSVDGDNIGSLRGQVRAGLPARGALTDASVGASSLEGRIEMATNSFRWISPLVGGNWRVDGTLGARLELAGTVGRPRASGFITGNDLSAREAGQGMQLSNGVLAAELAGDRIDVKVLRFESGEGSVAISGLLQPAGSGRSEARLVIDRLPLPLGRAQRVILSGSTAATLEDQLLSVSGKLVADAADIVLDAGLAPGIGLGAGLAPGSVLDAGLAADSALRRTRTALAATIGSGLTRIDSDIAIDLGRHFDVTGGGLEGRLRGSIRLRNVGLEAPHAAGTVEVVDGSYQVQGRKLKIRRGQIVFEGPFDDPMLDIVAVRENLRVEPGLAIGGTAMKPVATLVSNPEVPDADKLAWLVLGTGLQDAPGPRQAEALQSAAVSLFGDGGVRYASAEGAAPVADPADPSAVVSVANRLSPSAAPVVLSEGSAVGLGRRLSSRLFATCEESVRAVWNILKLQYEITDSLSMSVKAGGNGTVDLLGFYPFVATP